MRERPPVRINNLLYMAFNRNGICWAFLNAYLTPNTWGNLCRYQHHPLALRPWPRNGTLAFRLTLNLTSTRRTSHIQTTHGAKVHTNTTINARVFVHQETVGHPAPLSHILTSHIMQRRAGT